jgi:hypothetical protein
MKLNRVVLSRPQIMKGIPLDFHDHCQDLPACTDKLRQIGTETWIFGAMGKSKFNPRSIIAIGLDTAKNLFLQRTMKDSKGKPCPPQNPGAKFDQEAQLELNPDFPPGELHSSYSPGCFDRAVQRPQNP